MIIKYHLIKKDNSCASGRAYDGFLETSRGSVSYRLTAVEIYDMTYKEIVLPPDSSNK
ncbi:MAG: hypothetical protein ACYDAJ_11835 [Nitrosotalea sp.]